MILLCVFTVITLVGLWLTFYVWDYRFDLLGFICLLIGGFGLLTWGLLILCEWNCNSKMIRRREVIVTTIANSKASSELIERAGILTEVLKWNEWLAEAKHYNNGLFDIAIPDVVDTLQPIK